GRGAPPAGAGRRPRTAPRHLITVFRLTRSRAATAVLLRASAQASTIRARSASPCAVFRRFAQFSSVRRSAWDSTSGSSLLSPMSPAERGSGAPSPPSRVLRPNTTHVVIRELKTGTLGRCAHEPFGLVLDFDGYLRQGGRVLPIVMRAEQQFQAIGEQNPDISPGAAAVTAVDRGKRIAEERGSACPFALLAGLASGPK